MYLKKVFARTVAWLDWWLPRGFKVVYTRLCILGCAVASPRSYNLGMATWCLSVFTIYVRPRVWCFAAGLGLTRFVFGVFVCCLALCLVTPISVRLFARLRLRFSLLHRGGGYSRSSSFAAFIASFVFHTCIFIPSHIPSMSTPSLLPTHMTPLEASIPRFIHLRDAACLKFSIDFAVSAALWYHEFRWLICCNAVRVRTVPIVSYVNPSIFSTCSLIFLLSRRVTFRSLLSFCSLPVVLRRSSCSWSSLVSLCSCLNVRPRNVWSIPSSWFVVLRLFE